MESLDRADFIVLKGDTPNPMPAKPSAKFQYGFQEIKDHASGKTIPEKELPGMRLMAVSAIADPDSFENTLKDCGVLITSAKRFLDHHIYTEQELSGLLQEAGRSASSLVMTEKDSVKLPEGFPATILSVRMVWQKGEKELEDALFKAVS